MSIFEFPPFAAVLSTTASLVEALIAALAPVASSAAPAVAVVLVTVLVRLALLPLALRAARSDSARRRLAPRLTDLRRRFGHDPVRFQSEVAGLYRREGVSPFAGILPLLAQAPVLSVLYGVFSRATIAGAPNLLLVHDLAGMPLSGAILPGVLSGVLPVPALLVGIAVLTVALLAAELTRRRGVALQRLSGGGMPAAVRALSGVLPFAGVAVAAFVPLAAALYLVTSSMWGAIERPALAAAVAR